MSYADINGQRIRFDDTGGDGPPVILAHGFLMDRTMFAPQVSALSGEFRVITWDERGFGETEFDGQPFTYWDSARDCLGLLDGFSLHFKICGGITVGCGDTGVPKPLADCEDVDPGSQQMYGGAMPDAVGV